MRKMLTVMAPRRRAGVLALLGLVAAAAAWIAPEPAAQGGFVHRMTKITDTIYKAEATGSPGMNSTSWVFINDDDVLVTDSEGSPASAKSLLAGVATVTSKPVRYLVDTHFHFDHAYGNAGLPPSVQVIGSDYTRRALLGPEARQGVTFRTFVDPMPARDAALRKQVAAESDPQRKAKLEAQLRAQEATTALYAGDFPLRPPTLTVSSSTSIWSGSKEFRIMWVGRAHTAGDLITYVPSERVVATGDIVFKGIVGWQGDAFPNEHPATLEAVKKLDLDMLLPGHGEHVQGRANIDQVIGTMQAYLREEWRQAAEAKKQGLSPEAAMKRMDFSKFREAYGDGVTPNVLGIRRIYDIIDKKVATQ
jgi:glyoxylase-like metal-dependent hydrolase (beta-lactamase superfamily II)